MRVTELLLIMFLIVVMGCQGVDYHDNLNIDSYNFNKGLAVLNLDDFSYQDVVLTLQTAQESQSIQFLRDGMPYKRINDFTLCIESEPENGKYIFQSQQDSVELILTTTFASLRVYNAKDYAIYISYYDSAYQDYVKKIYNISTETTKSLVARSLTFQFGQEPMKQNLSRELQVKEPLENSKVNLLWKQKEFFPQTKSDRTPYIKFWILKEKGAHNLHHEIEWQIRDARKSLRNVQGNINLDFRIEQCDFASPNEYSGQVLDAFEKYIDTKPRYNEDYAICVLMRWGPWGDGPIGLANLGTYNVNYKPEFNRKARALCASCSWWPYTLAHELGHIFGAWHVKRQWWNIFGYDVMVSGGDWTGSYKHKTATNRRAVFESLTLK